MLTPRLNDMRRVDVIMHAKRKKSNASRVSRRNESAAANLTPRRGLPTAPRASVGRRHSDSSSGSAGAHKANRRKLRSTARTIAHGP